MIIIKLDVTNGEPLIGGAQLGAIYYIGLVYQVRRHVALVLFQYGIVSAPGVA